VPRPHLTSAVVLLQRDPKAVGVNQQAPYFSLFLDCVHQLLEQDHSAFEFNQAFLFSLFENANACRFGTFMFDSQQEREFYGVMSKTQSFWAYTNSAKHKPKFLNPFYRENSAIKEVSPDSRSIRFWEGFYNPWVRKQGFDRARAISKLETLKSACEECVSFSFFFFIFECAWQGSDPLVVLSVFLGSRK